MDAESKQKRKARLEKGKEKAAQYKRISRKSIDIPAPKVEQPGKGKGVPYNRKKEKRRWRGET